MTSGEKSSSAEAQLEARCADGMKRFACGGDYCAGAREVEGGGKGVAVAVGRAGLSRAGL